MLPAWTNHHPDWRVEVQPSLKIQGEVDMKGGGSFRNVPIDTAHTHLSYSNLTWRLPDLQISRPEGRLRVAHVASDMTKDFYWRVDSTIDPKALAPIL